MIKKTYKEKTVKEKVLVNEQFFCDKCGAEIKRDTYSVDKCHFTIREGENYPSGYSADIVEAYFCEECQNLIKTILEENGVVFTERSESY